MARTKRELIQFMDELVELASEENKTRAILVKEKFISDFEKSYEYEKEVQTEVSYEYLGKLYLPKDGNVVETWKSDGKPHVIDRIPVGEYILREETAP